MAAKKRNITGKRNPFFGRKHSQETKDYLSKINMGRPCPNVGYRHSPEMKKKLSAIRKKLCKNPQVILNMSLAQKSKPVTCVSDNTTYKSIKEAARHFNIHYSNLKTHLKGKTKSCGGLVFKFS